MQSAVRLRNGETVSTCEMRHGDDDLGDDRYGLVALDSNGRVRGRARYLVIDRGCAELEMQIVDELYGEGLAALLTERLAEHAERHGIERLVAPVLPINRAVLDALRDGWGTHVAWSGGVNSIELPTANWRAASMRQRPSPADAVVANA